MKVDIVFSVSNEYTPLFSVALKSVAFNSSKNNIYNIYVLHSNLAERNQELIKSECETYKNIKIIFINVEEYLPKEDRSTFFESGYVTKETYYRFYIPQILPDLEKVIYSDVDVVFNTDIVNLYSMSIKNYLLAAAPNISAIYNYNRDADLPNGQKYKFYFDNILNLKDVNGYIQAGISLFNLNEMRKFDFTKKCLEKLKEVKTPVFYDQDIINSVCQKKIKLLPLKWNHVWYFWTYDFLKKHTPKTLYKEYDNSRKNAYVYHFAGPKPIKEKAKPLAWQFWKYAMYTKFYAHFLKQAFGEKTRLLGVSDKIFDNMEEIKPSFKEQIPVLFSSSNTYAPYLGITIYSLLKHMDKNTNYDLIVMETSIDNAIKDKIKALVEKYPNCSIRFLNLQKELAGYSEIFYVHGTLSKETYFRLFADRIFKNYDKMIYVDADTLILSDLKDLYNINLKDNYVAGVKDYVVQSRYKNRVFINNVDIKDYFDNFIAFDYRKYIQCGVLVLNIKQMKKDDFSNKAIRLLQYLKNPYYVDQDVINKVSEDKIYYLTPDYNYLMFYRQLNIHNISEEFQDEILDAKSKMKIFHMPGGKPDEFPHYEFSPMYFQYALESPFSAEIINKMITVDRHRCTDGKINQLQKENSELRRALEENQYLVQNLKNIAKFNRNKKKYYKYKILSKLSFGKMKQKYKAKYSDLKKLKDCYKYLN